MLTLTTYFKLIEISEVCPFLYNYRLETTFTRLKITRGGHDESLFLFFFFFFYKITILKSDISLTNPIEIISALTFGIKYVLLSLPLEHSKRKSCGIALIKIN